MGGQSEPLIFKKSPLVSPAGGGGAQARPVVSRGTLGTTRSTPRLYALDERVLAAGQGKKVALTAGRRKFLPIRNALMRHRTPWQAQEGQG